MVKRAEIGRVVAIAAIILGLLLMTLNIGGVFVPITEHPTASQTRLHKVNLVRPSFQKSLAALNRLGNSPEQLIAEANQIVAARIVNYWPEPGESDTHTMHSFLENWVLALVQRGEAWLTDLGLRKTDIARVGRRDFRQILAKGVGLCGMAAIALVDYLQEKGTPAKILVLQHHVVAYVSLPSRNYILDPDHGVVIANVPAPPELSIPKIVAAYQKAGYGQAKVQKIARKYAAQMRLYEPARFQNRKRRLLLMANISKWGSPLALIALGGFLVRRAVAQPRGLPHRPAGIFGRAD
jgi:hypothetical protein